MQDATVARQQVRKPAGGRAQLAFGLAAAHYYVSGMPFRPPVEHHQLDARQQNEIATFGRLSTKDDDQYSDMHGHALEPWSVEDESLTGTRMRRSADTPGGRVAPGQFIALRHSDSAHFVLGSVRWVQQNADASIEAGISLMPGIPQAIAAHVAEHEAWLQAFLLPMSDALKAPQAIVTPAGWGRVGRVIDVNNGVRTWQLAASAVVERLHDAERVAYT